MCDRCDRETKQDLNEAIRVRLRCLLGGGLAGVASHVGGPIWARAARLLPVLHGIMQPAFFIFTSSGVAMLEYCMVDGCLALCIFYNLTIFTKEFHI